MFVCVICFRIDVAELHDSLSLNMFLVPYSNQLPSKEVHSNFANPFLFIFLGAHYFADRSEQTVLNV